jgi:hypothetical protein
VKATLLLKTLTSLALLPWTLTACSGDDPPAENASAAATTSPATSNTTNTSGAGGNGSATTGTTATTGAPAGCISAMASDGSLQLDAMAANNYTFTSNVTVNVQNVAANSGLTIDWSGLTVDLLNHNIDPATNVVTVLMAVLRLTVDEFQMKVNANESLEQYNSCAAAYYPTAGETSADLYDFLVPGEMTPIAQEDIDAYLDPAVYDPAEFTYAVLVQDHPDPAIGVRMVQPIRLDTTSVDTTVFVDNDSASLTYETDLTAVQPVEVPAGTGNITINWSALVETANNALGQIWKQRKADEVMVGHYPMTPAEMSTRFLDLEEPGVATRLYRGEVVAGAFKLMSELTDGTGQAFAGIDSSEGTWIVAVNCSTCTNPAPWFLTILQPCGG